MKNLTRADGPMDAEEGALRRQLFLMAGFAGLSLRAGPVLSQTSALRRRAGTVNFVEGDVRLSDEAGSRALAGGTVVREGQTLETSVRSEVHVVFDDGGFLAVRPSSRVQIEQVKIAGSFDDSLSLRLFSGALRSITGWIGKFDKKNYQLSTTVATVGIRGTDHELAIIAAGQERRGEIPGIHNWVHEGGTTLKSPGGEINIEPGHAAWAPHTGEAPKAHQAIPRYLQQRRTRHEARIEAHAKRITEHIEMRMKKRGMLKNGEKLEDAQRRHLATKASKNAGREENARHERAEASKPAGGTGHHGKK